MEDDPGEIRHRIQEVQRQINMLENRKQVLHEKLELLSGSEAVTNLHEGGDPLDVQVLAMIPERETIHESQVVESITESGEDADEVRSSINRLVNKGAVYRPKDGLLRAA